LKHLLDLLQIPSATVLRGYLVGKPVSDITLRLIDEHLPRNYLSITNQWHELQRSSPRATRQISLKAAGMARQLLENHPEQAAAALLKELGFTSTEAQFYTLHTTEMLKELLGQSKESGKKRSGE
jgi:hypothetical protein